MVLRMLASLLLARAGFRANAETEPRPPFFGTPLRSVKLVELSYVELSNACGDAHALSGRMLVGSLAECEQKCDAQAASAPGTGQPSCIAVDSDGEACYLKSACDGTPGHCISGMCGYRRTGNPPSPTPPAPPVPPAPPGMTLRQAAAKHKIFIGAATSVSELQNESEPQYAAVEQAQFSLTTAENACKFGPIHPKLDEYDWKGCDTIFAAAAATNQSVRGHNLCWHTENPTWLMHGNFSADELTHILQNHISTVVAHYGHRALAWDVVNEAVDSNGLKPSAPWYPNLPNYIDIAFQAARAAGGPNLKLFYNDYAAEGMNKKSEQVYRLVSDMQKRGVPIDGVGMQFHWSLDAHDPLSDVAANMKRLGALGLEVHITELDIKCVPEGSTRPCTRDRLNAQAALYAQILSTCLAAPNCKSIETWGFTDRHTWIGSATAPLLFDMDYQPKPAVDAMINLMLNTTYWDSIEAVVI